MLKELINNSKAAEILSSATYTGDQNGSKVDVTDVRFITTLLHVSGYTDGTHDFTAQYAADDGTGSPDAWEDIPSKYLVGSYPTVEASADTGVYLVGLISPRMFVRVNTSTSSTSTGATYGISAMLSGLRYDNAGRNPATDTV